MLAHRLLRVAGGGGGAATITPSSAVTLTSDPKGGWTIPNPAGWYDAASDRTFFVYVNASDGGHEVGQYDHATQTTTTFRLANAGPDDGATDVHNNPSLLVRGDGKIVVAYSSHEDTRVRVRISSSAGDISAFASEQVLDPGYGGVYTYAMLVQLNGIANDPIYLFSRSIPNLGTQVGRLAYTVSTDGGASWSSWSLLFTGASSPAKVPYWTITSDWDTRFDVFTSSAGNSADLYHFYFDGTDAKTYKSDGTEITTSRPFVVGDMTQVYDGTGSGGSFALGASWDGSAASLLYVRLISSGTDNDLWTARWRGGAWTRQQVVSTVGGRHPNNAYLPSANVSPTDEDSVLVHAKVGSRYEAFLYTTSDDGASWSGEQLTSSSSVDQMWAMPVYYSTGKFDWLWLAITYTSDTNYSAGVIGYGRG